MTTDEMARLHAACFTTPRPWTAAEIGVLLDSSFAFALQDPLGFLIGRVIAGEAELLTLAVAPAARRQGVGARLLDGFLAEAAQRKADNAFLEVAEDNAAARALYLRAGFAQSGRRRGYYAGPDGQRLDALVFFRAIPG